MEAGGKLASVVWQDRGSVTLRYVTRPAFSAAIIYSLRIMSALSGAHYVTSRALRRVMRRRDPSIHYLQRGRPGCPGRCGSCDRRCPGGPSERHRRHFSSSDFAHGQRCSGRVYSLIAAPVRHGAWLPLASRSGSRGRDSRAVISERAIVPPEPSPSQRSSAPYLVKLSSSGQNDLRSTGNPSPAAVRRCATVQIVRSLTHRGERDASPPARCGCSVWAVRFE